jgi:competence protein ComEA
MLNQEGGIMTAMKFGVQAICAALVSVLLAVPALAGSVDINKADAATIASELKGIGPAKAKAIVEYRTKNGPFKSIEDLRKVGGIGDSLLAKIRNNVVVTGADSQKKPAS